MSLSVSKGIIVDAAKDLKAAYQKARREWDDDMARKFEEEFLEPLAPKIRSAVTAMDKLSAASMKAERDCS